jgi:D-alanyl-D-alanine carboxypeptidase
MRSGRVTSLNILYNQPVRIALATLLTATVAAAVIVAQPPAAAPAGEFAELETLAQSELQALHAPGAVVALVKGDRVVYQKAVGIANIESGQPMAADMLFRVGSVTKMFTTAALVSLAEEGRLKLSDPVAKVAVGLNSRLGRLTAHQLMSHTAGLRDEAPTVGPHDEGALATTVRAWGEDYVFLEPGRVMSYSNPGMTLAGYVLEQVAKKPYAEVIDERLFQPLGMTHSTFRPTAAMSWPLAQGHEGTGTDVKVVRPFVDHAGYWPAGFMFSNAGDLARFTIAFMNDGIFAGRSVLKPSAIVTLSTGYVDIPSSAEPARYAYGLTTGMHRGARVVEHGGSIPGFGASVRMLPDRKAAVVILVNKSGATLAKTSERALELLAPLQPALAPPTAPIAMDGSEISKYAGSYTNPPTRIDLIAREGKLYLKRGAQEAEVVKVGDLRFLTVSAGGAPAQRFTLLPGPDGQIAFLHTGSRAFKKAPIKVS